MAGIVPKVRLGHNGPMVGIQGIGCMGMSEFYGASDDAESLATLDHALDLGITMLDTADMYGRGHNEELIAKLLRRRRNEMVIATKCGFERRDDDAKYIVVNNRPDYIRQAAEASLRRLGIDVIDLYYLHRRDPAVPLADSIGAMAELVTAGKVRHLGICSVTGDELREAHAVHPIAAIQSEWSLFSRDVEATAVPAAAALGVAFVPFSPLGRGMLAAPAPGAAGYEADDIRNMLPRFTGEAGESNARLAAEVARLAAMRGVTPAQLALAWVHMQSRVQGLTVVPIPGTRKQSRLEENVAAAKIELTDSELATLAPLAAVVQGERFAMSAVQGGKSA